MLKTTERIISTEDLAQQANQAIANAQQEPLVVTADGRPAAYLISVELYDALREHLHQLEQSELIAGIKKGQEQFAKGQFKTLEEITPPSFLDVARSLNLDGPPDWSTNLHKYL